MFIIPNLEKIKSQDKTLVVAGADEEHVINAISLLPTSIQLKKILIGDKSKIESFLKSHKIDDCVIIDILDRTQVGVEAVKQIKNGANILMKGLIESRDFLKPIVNSETGIKQGKVLSHVCVVNRGDNSFIFSDGAMVISPTLEQKENIMLNAITVAKSLGIKKPKVAFVSAIEKVNPAIPATVDADELKKKYSGSNIADVDGPFAIDNIFSKESAKTKGITSPVALDADILIVPDLNSGNIFYKTLTCLCGFSISGLVVGGTCPIILTSRGDSAESKKDSILLSLLQ